MPYLEHPYINQYSIVYLEFKCSEAPCTLFVRARNPVCWADLLLQSQDV